MEPISDWNYLDNDSIGRSFSQPSIWKIARSFLSAAYMPVSATAVHLTQIHTQIQLRFHMLLCEKGNESDDSNLQSVHSRRSVRDLGSLTDWTYEAHQRLHSTEWSLSAPVLEDQTKATADSVRTTVWLQVFQLFLVIYSFQSVNNSIVSLVVWCPTLSIDVLFASYLKV